MMLMLLAIVCLNVYLYMIVPKGFFPQQDTGRLIGFIQADQSISFQAMQPKLASFIDIVRADPAVENVVAFTGGAQRNTGRMFVALKPLAERKESADKIIARLRSKLAKEPGANLFLKPVQDIRVGGRQANAQYQYTLQADDLDELRTWEPAHSRGALAPAATGRRQHRPAGQGPADLAGHRPRHRRAARRHRRSMIDATLNDAFGQRQVSTIYSAQPVSRRHGGGAPSTGNRPTRSTRFMSAHAKARRCRCRLSPATSRPTRRWASITRASSSLRRSRSICPRTSR